MATIGPVRYASSGDLQIAYQEFGGGPSNVVVVPGFVSNLDFMAESLSFRPLFDRVGALARSVVFDKRGTGLSDRDLGFGSLEERADDIRAVMDAAGMERARLVAYSEGGPLSLVFAATYPERVEGLAIYGSFARILVAPDYPIGVVPALTEALVNLVRKEWGSGRALRPFVQHTPDTEEVRTMQARYERGACTPTMAAHILEANASIDVRPLLPAVSAPTLVLHSTHDPLIGCANGEYLAEHLPNARFVAGDADYHWIWDGDELWFVDELEGFLSDDRARPTATTRFLGTVLFTDIVDSTEQAAGMGDDAWRALLDRHDTVTSRTVAAHGGRVVKTTGDGVVATLDGPSRAVACAVAIRDSTRDLGLAIRAGVHTGEFERRGDDIGGLGVNIGSRVAAVAGAGEVWVSRTVKDLTSGSGLRFVDRGAHELKGVPDAWELYSLDA